MKRRIRARPRPEPAYSSPARRSGVVSPTRSFTQGVLKLKSSAEAIAKRTPAGARPTDPPGVVIV
jgi:hypothetical protein